MYNLGNSRITMSLESYKKALEAQQERERKFSNEAKPKSEERIRTQEPEYVYVEAKPRKKHSGCVNFIILLAALFIVSAIKNPSERESKEMVKSFIVEKVNNKLRGEMTNEDNDGAKQFGALLGMAFASNIIDYVSEINVTDYIIFTSFDCTTKVDDSERTIVSGIIFLGKIIPLKSDIKSENLKAN